MNDSVDANGALHSGQTGRFTGHVQNELDPADVLTADPAMRAVGHIETMIARGQLSPAARGMEPREAIEQWAEANVASLREQQAEYEQAGMYLRLTPDALVAGDAVDLEPIIREFGDSEVDEADLMAAECELAEVLEIEDDGALVIHTTQGTWGVPRDFRVDMQLGSGRCAKCGEPKPEPGLCQECFE